MPADLYVIWSIEHGAWWRPDRRGYTGHINDAGHYTLAECAVILEQANYRITHECAIPLSAVDVALNTRE